MCSDLGKRLDVHSSKGTQQQEGQLQVVLYEPSINRAW